MSRRLESVYVFVVENSDGDEGVAALPVGRRLEPMIATTAEKLEILRVQARGIVQNSGQRMRVVRFMSRVDVEEIP